MEKNIEITLEKVVSWKEINRKNCEEASLNDMSGWYELD